MSGIMVCMRIERTDPSRQNACIDYGMKLKVFVPQSQKTYTFILDDLEVRLAIEGHVGRDGLSGAEILNPDNIMAIADRLLVRVINGKPVVIFSRRGRAERGRARDQEGGGGAQQPRQGLAHRAQGAGQPAQG